MSGYTIMLCVLPRSNFFVFSLNQLTLAYSVKLSLILMVPVKVGFSIFRVFLSRDHKQFSARWKSATTDQCLGQIHNVTMYQICSYYRICHHNLLQLPYMTAAAATKSIAMFSQLRNKQSHYTDLSYIEIGSRREKHVSTDVQRSTVSFDRPASTAINYSPYQMS